MQFYKAFLTNISLLITIGYIFNLVYKYIFVRTASTLQTGLVPVLFICSGWLAMLFGLQLTETILFDLRYVPILFAALVFRKPATLILIGLGIGAGRLFFGINAAAWAGFANMIILGIASSLLVIWFRDRDWSYRCKALIAILTINTLNIINIALLGIIPVYEFFTQIAIYTYPLGLILSGLFIFIIRDFQKERKRVQDLRNMNVILRRQTRELRTAKRELEEKARQLMQASRYKSEFLANMSHELKTPLNSIILLSQMMKENEEEKQTHAPGEVNYADIILAAGNDLLYLINDILDLSKVEAGKMDINIEYVAMDELLQMTEHQFRALAQQKGLHFEVMLGQNLPGGLYIDALRVNQILRNLLVNAFKFTEEGGVTLQVSVEDSSQEEGKPLRMNKRRFLSWNNAAWYGGFNSAVNRAIRRGQRTESDVLQRVMPQQWIVFAVQDTGIGIDEEKQQQIFEAFQQADGATTRKYGGTGLGLSISLQLAHLLGGTLTLHSRRGEGSTFTLRLPLRENQS
ncbi:sensor histidine kinase [Paenibacillus daejeonensis]|uniref:ATP-binding protein n=1 Tax=Paenibacillus daejeonensis TaxID=135193 RepID=UPI0003690933|nr:ATP-binding protein [Paenibacillus daejeonensis]